MNNTKIRRTRMLGATAACAVAIGATCMLGAGAADAHVTASANGLKQGGYGVITLNVPNESDTNASTTELTVTVPHLKSALPQAKPGWNVAIQKDPQTDEVTSITWTAAPGAPGVPAAQFDQFAFAGGPLPSTPQIALPALQKYSDGETVDWNQPTPADGTEPDHPAPTVTLGAKDKDQHGDVDDIAAEESDASSGHSSGKDDTARWLGGAGILVGALGLGAAAGALATRGKTKGGDKS